MLVAQAIYKLWANKRRRPCPCYFVVDKVWLNTRNIWTPRPIAKLYNPNICPYWVAGVFSKNPLIGQLNLPKSFQIHLVFHVCLLQYEASNLLPKQHQDSQELVIALHGAKKLCINRILNLKYNCQFKPPLLCYFVDLEGDHLSWEQFHLLTNCQSALDNYHAENPTADGPYIFLCNIPDCQCACTLRSLA